MDHVTGTPPIGRENRKSLHRTQAIDDHANQTSPDDFNPEDSKPVNTEIYVDDRLVRLSSLGRSSSFSYFQRNRMASPVSCLKGSSNNSSNNSLRSENRPPKRVSWVDEIDVMTFNKDARLTDGSPAPGSPNCQRVRRKTWSTATKATRRSASFELGYTKAPISRPDDSYRSRHNDDHDTTSTDKKSSDGFKQWKIIEKTNDFKDNEFHGTLKPYNGQSHRLERGWAVVRTKFIQIVTAVRDDIDF